MDWLIAFQEFFLTVFGPVVVFVLAGLVGASGVITVSIIVANAMS